LLAGQEHGRTIPLPEPLPERREPLFQFRISLRQGDHDANPARLLRARRERPGGCGAPSSNVMNARRFIRTWSASCPPGKG
jgi:hypothetical protein